MHSATAKKMDRHNIPSKFLGIGRIFACGLVVALPFDNAFFHLFSLLLLLMFCMSLRWTGLLALKNTLVENKSIHIAFAAIWATMLIANVLNDQSAEAWRNMVQFGFRYWLLFVIFSHLLVIRIVSPRLMFIAAVFGLAWQFTPFIPSMLDLSIFDSRFSAMNRNSNIAGFQAAGLALMTLYLVFHQNLERRIRYSLAAPLGTIALIALFASGNRGSWVALLLASGLFMAAMLPRQPKKVISIGLIVAVFAAIVLTQFSIPSQRLALLTEGYSSHRFAVWQNALDLYSQKPIFGFGLDTREVMLKNYNLKIYHEHNVFISVLTAVGIVGLLAYLALIASIFRLGLKYRNYFALLMLIFILARGMFAFDFYRKQIFLAPFVIIAAVAAYRNEDTNPIRPNA